VKYKIEYKNPADLIPYKLNAKKHPDEQIRLLKYSIDTFKPDQPIVIDEKGVIIKGHARRVVAMELGMKEFPVIVRSDLSEKEKKAARIADNRTAESGWDTDILALELPELDIDLNDMGFDERYLDSLGMDMNDPAGLGDEKPPDDFSEYDENIPTEHQCPKCGYKWSGKSE